MGNYMYKIALLPAGEEVEVLVVAEGSEELLAQVIHFFVPLLAPY